LHISYLNSLQESELENRPKTGDEISVTKFITIFFGKTFMFAKEKIQQKIKKCV